jgi:hypothetical protein
MGALFALLFLADVVYGDVANTDMLSTELMEWSCSSIGGAYHDGTTEAPDGTKYPRIFVPVGGNGREAVAASVPLCSLR